MCQALVTPFAILALYTRSLTSPPAFIKSSTKDYLIHQKENKTICQSILCNDWIQSSTIEDIVELHP